MQAGKEMMSFQMDKKDHKKIISRAKKIGTSAAAYVRNVIIDELRSNKIFNRMTGKVE